MFIASFLTTGLVFSILPWYIFWPLWVLFMYWVVKSFVVGICRAFYRTFIQPMVESARWEQQKAAMYDHVGFQATDLPAPSVPQESEESDNSRWEEYKNSQHLG